MRYLFGVVACAIATQAYALDDLDRMQLATSLGSVLGSEKGCGLTFSQPAIEKFIDDNVPADDMEFPSMLSMMTDGSEIQLREMSASSKTAHCRQISRIAKSYGFVN